MRPRFLFAVVATTLAAGAFPSGSARAEGRMFGFTYPYMTEAKGERTLEYYLDMGLLPELSVRPDLNPDLTDLRPAFQHQIEFEYGITDKLEFGFFSVFQQDAMDALWFRGPKLRTRYRFAEEGRLPVDLGVLGEVGYFGDEFEIQERLIVAKRVRKIEIALNLTFVEEIERAVECADSGGAVVACPPEGTNAASSEVVSNFELEIVPSLGFGYHLNERIALGLELAPEIELGDETSFTSALGPTVAIFGSGFRWVIAAQFRVHSEEPTGTSYEDGDFVLRSILGVSL